MNNVIINRGQGGLGRQPLGQDYISGLVFYGTVPSLFPAGGMAKFGGIQDALNAGIIPTGPGAYSDETPCVVEFSVAMGNVGDTVNISFQEPFQNVLLCSYSQQSTDTSDTILAASIAAAINKALTGYTATVFSSTNIKVTLRPGLGVYANTNYATLFNFTYVKTGVLLIGGTTTKTQSGVASILSSWYYHINRFFVQSPNSTLYVGIFNESVISGYSFPEVGTIQAYANGAIRQLGIYIPTPYVNLTQTFEYVTAVQSQIKTLIANNNPLSAFIGTDFTSTSLGAANLTDISGLNSEHVSLVVGQDGAAQGAGIVYSQGFSITQLGDVLGMVSSSQVSDDIAWVATYTLSPDGIENAVPAFATTDTSGKPQLLSNLTSGTINSVDAYRYIFGRQFVNDSPNGTYVNDSHCATAYTSDYAYVENNRTFDKAARQLYAAYIEQLAAPLVLNPDGTLSNSTVAFFEGLGEQALSNMAQNNPNTGRPELSGFSVTINPAQNVLQTSTLVVTIKLEPVGVAREIILNLQFAVSL